MSSEYWIVREHIINASHGREFARGVRNEENDRLRLAVKCWTPKSNPTPSPGDITIIFCHGVGSSKEDYEPFFDDLLKHYKHIRSVWAFDVAWHGASYQLNKEVIGDDPGWRDYARDLLHMINTYQEDMPPPILAVGQSWGSTVALIAASMHQRLFYGIVAIEPALWNRAPDGTSLGGGTIWMANRKDRWTSRQAAREYLRALPYFRRFDERVFERVVQYDLRDVPRDEANTSTPKDGPKREPEVELTTPKAMEVYTMIRPNPILPGVVSKPESRMSSLPGFYRPEVILMEQIIPSLYTPVLYVWGKESNFHQFQNYHKDLLNTTGTAPGGSGGAAAGLVSEVWISNCQHPVPLERPNDCAKAVTPWMASQAERWMKMSRAAREAAFHTASVNPQWSKTLQKL